MDNILGFYVFDGRQWLADDEKTWTNDFYSAASFTTANMANAIGEREGGDRVIYVLACLGSQ